MTHPHHRTLRYATPATIRWVVDDDRVIVLDIASETPQVLTGREALIWRCLSLSQDLQRLVDLVHRISGLSATAAEQELRATFDHWTELGLFHRVATHHHG